MGNEVINTDLGTVIASIVGLLTAVTSLVYAHLNKIRSSNDSNENGKRYNGLRESLIKLEAEVQELRARIDHLKQLLKDKEEEERYLMAENLELRRTLASMSSKK